MHATLTKRHTSIDNVNTEKQTIFDYHKAPLY